MPTHQKIRRILKIRDVAGSVVVSLPKELRVPLGILPHDYVMIELDTEKRCLILTREE